MRVPADLLGIPVIGLSGLTNPRVFEQFRLDVRRVAYQDLWCNCWQVAREGLTKVVRFPRECPKCGAIMAMPVRAGTLAEMRTQVDLRCDHCGHELTIEMTPPVLIVTPERETDGGASPVNDAATVLEESQADDRRTLHRPNTQRMRVGLRGLLKSAGGSQTVTVLYSLDGHRARGRMRPLDPGNRFPSWVEAESRLTLNGYDGLPLDISVTAVKLPRDDRKGDDHFAEFVVREATR